MTVALVEPIPNAPAATARVGDERALVVADYHAGIEAGLRYERGVELASQAAERRARVLSLCDRTDPDRVVVLGDLAHRIGEPGTVEREELTALVDAVTDRVPMTLVPGNHDGGLDEVYGDRLDVAPPGGVRLGDVGLLHGHTWPAPTVLGAETVCMGHEHPTVRLQDSVGGSRVERAWLRGRLRRAPFDARRDDPTDGDESADCDESPRRDAPAWNDPELVVFPAFNDRSGGTWVNVEGQSFLAPFLPDALESGDAYLLDGTRLGPYREV
ncbi:MAG: metallophosphoesterase [Haloferacaceae archaeon]